MVHAEALGFVRLLAFRDYAGQTLRADEGARAGVSERRLAFVRALGTASVSLADLRARRHPAAALYRGATNKTLTRDVNYLRERGLVLVEDGELRANLGLMHRFAD